MPRPVSCQLTLSSLLVGFLLCAAVAIGFALLIVFFIPAAGG